MLIPGKLYRLNLKGSNAEGITMQPAGVGHVSGRVWPYIARDSILMCIKSVPDEKNALLTYFLAGDKIVTWWSHKPDEEFKLAEAADVVNPG